MSNRPGKKARATADPTRSAVKSDEVRALANRALAVLASHAQTDRLGGAKAHMEEFCNAMVDNDDRLRHDVIARLIALGNTTEDIIEHYVPKAARELGERWVDDKLTFAEVTIGASRLQDTIRMLGARYESGGVTIPLGHKILIAVPNFEQHTLGAFIAASQFRRRGVWVHMAIDLNAEETLHAIETQDFSMLGFSISSQRSIEPTRELVEKIRREVDSETPIVLGGAVTGLEIDVQEAAGSDFASSDVGRVLEFCGLAAQQRSLAPARLLS